MERHPLKQSELGPYRSYGLPATPHSQSGTAEFGRRARERRINRELGKVILGIKAAAAEPVTDFEQLPSTIVLGED